MSAGEQATVGQRFAALPNSFHCGCPTCFLEGTRNKLVRKATSCGAVESYTVHAVMRTACRPQGHSQEAGAQDDPLLLRRSNLLFNPTPPALLVVSLAGLKVIRKKLVRKAIDMIKKLADGSAKAAEELEAAQKEAGEGERLFWAGCAFCVVEPCFAV